MMFSGCSSYDIEQQYPPSIINNPSTSPSSWLHTPPAQMPWGIPLAEQPSVMRFTGDSCSSARVLAQNLQSTQRKKMLETAVGKRKSFESDLDCAPPSKQLITDEKMAANLSGLHISNNYKTHQFGSSVEEDNKPLTSGDSRNDTLDNLPSLVLCEELRRLTSEPVIPPSLMNKIERPTNALVLWQPPGGSICDKLRMAVEHSSSESVTQSNNTSSCSMEETEEVEPQPSTSGLSQFTHASVSQSIWPDFVDNNNSSNTVDLNLLSGNGPFVRSISGGTTSDDAMMDL